MRSIRRTILLNFLLLFSVTLVVASWFVYRTSADAIEDKRKSTRSLIDLRYQSKLDEALLLYAQELSTEAQSQYRAEDLQRMFVNSEVNAILAASAPGPIFPLVTHLSMALPNPVAFFTQVRLTTTITLNEDELPFDHDHAKYEYVQITSDWGARWQSQTLNNQALPLQIKSQSGPSTLFQSSYENVELYDGSSARLVTIKVPVTRFSRIGTYFSGRGFRRVDYRPTAALYGSLTSIRPAPSSPGPIVGPPPTPPPDTRWFSGFSLPSMYVQVAWKTDERGAHPKFVTLLKQKAEELAAQERDNDRILSDLKNRLGITAAVAGMVILLVGWIIVGRSLSPLNRLSDAVSKISTKDFFVPLEARELPSEIRPVTQRLALALSELQMAFEREKRAAADISHELRTPIAALTTTLEVALRKERTTEQYQGTLAECLDISRQMNSLVERLLMLAWLDAGADLLRAKEFDLTALAKDCATIGRPLSSVRNIDFQLDCPQELLITTDRDKLREVLMNLVHNAIEYTHPGGMVRLKVVPPENDRLQILVEDTGIGMTQEVQSKIFERFFRADASRHETGVHAGLGLAVVKEYVEFMGGTVTVDSAPGRGSTFTVDLPYPGYTQMS
ncbi:MAG: HAMP domain-containing sensor histidine kinase [Zavarzinella sp.]